MWTPSNLWAKLDFRLRSSEWIKKTRKHAETKQHREWYPTRQITTVIHSDKAILGTLDRDCELHLVYSTLIIARAAVRMWNLDKSSTWLCTGAGSLSTQCTSHAPCTSASMLLLHRPDKRESMLFNLSVPIVSITLYSLATNLHAF